MPKTQPIIINGQSIPGAFFGKLCKLYTVDGAHRVLFKARIAKGIVRYCQKGIKHGWLASYSLEQEYNNKAMQDWIDTTFLKIKPEPKRIKEDAVMVAGKITHKDPDSIGDIINNILSKDN